MDWTTQSLQHPYTRSKQKSFFNNLVLLDIVRRSFGASYLPRMTFDSELVWACSLCERTTDSNKTQHVLWLSHCWRKDLLVFFLVFSFTLLIVERQHKILSPKKENSILTLSEWHQNLTFVSVFYLKTGLLSNFTVAVINILTWCDVVYFWLVV